MPRASLPSGSTSTPRQAPSRASQTTQKKRQTSRAAPRHETLETSSPVASSPDPLALAMSPEIGRRATRNKRVKVDDEVKNEDAAQNGMANGEAIGAEPTDEEKLDAWQDFAQDHYEMVEQLPLELHRNFRLLRELDDGCVDQTGKLQAQIRAYIAARLALVQRFAVVAGALQGDSEPGAASTEQAAQVSDKQNAQDSQNKAEADVAETGKEDQDQDAEVVEEPRTTVEDETISTNRDEQPEDTSTDPAPAATTITEAAAAPPMPDLPSDMGDPIPDGQGGLVVSSTEEMQEIIPPRNAFPSEPKADNTDAEGIASEPAQVVTAEEPPAGPTDEAKDDAPQLDQNDLPSKLLPEIGRLSREIVRNCEEKVALAVGAYNSIDRHIRALDSALSAQETSLILGLRPDTLPSSAVDQGMNLPADQSILLDGAGGDDDEQGMVLGIGGGAGGGRRRKKGKKGRKGDVLEVAAKEPEKQVADLPGYDGLEDNPNEPRYCYCNRVSYGTMIGCDNDDCPLEWFHLPCVGLQSEPSGSWRCDLCKPKVGLGMGGAGTVQPGVIEKRGKKRRR